MGRNSTTTLTVRLPDELRAKLDQLSRATERSRSWLAQDAIRAYLELNQWQTEEIQAGMREADAGEFATNGEVGAVRRRWSLDESD